MNVVTGFFRFWWDFLVGDNWEVAAGVVVMLIVVGVLARLVGVQAWLGPLAFVLVVLVIGGSLLREHAG
jgi:hypothetical protein